MQIHAQNFLSKKRILLEIQIHVISTLNSFLLPIRADVNRGGFDFACDNQDALFAVPIYRIELFLYITYPSLFLHLYQHKEYVSP